APLLQECAAAEKRGVFCIATPLDARALQPHARARIIALLRLWLHRHGQRSPSDGQLRTFHAQVFAAGRARAALHWRQTELRYFDNHLYLTRRGAQCRGDARGGRDWDLRACDLGRGLRIEMRAERDGGIEQRQLRGRAVRLMWRKGGERMTLPGRRHSSELKKLFQQHNVPPWERRALPLLLVDGEIAWAHGIGAGAACCARGTGISPRFVAS
ncbi:MAG: tRNA lysidine(34) synthetase TilS, partial [Alphaproteobacteria bacterium]